MTGTSNRHTDTASEFGWNRERQNRGASRPMGMGGFFVAQMIQGG